eukprot:scaffold135442_cov42-Prasinocladus_malaysianus.AAC.1
MPVGTALASTGGANCPEGPCGLAATGSVGAAPEMDKIFQTGNVGAAVWHGEVRSPSSIKGSGEATNTHEKRAAASDLDTLTDEAHTAKKTKRYPSTTSRFCARNDFYALRKLLGDISRNPDLLHEDPNLEFVRGFLLSFGANIGSPPEKESTPDYNSGEDEVGGDGEQFPAGRRVAPEDLKNNATAGSADTARHLTNSGTSASSDDDFARRAAAMQLVPPTPLLHARRAEALLNFDQPLESLRDCDAALQLDPECPQALKLRATVHRRMGNWQWAREDVKHGLELNAGDEEMAHVYKVLWLRHRNVLPMTPESLSARASLLPA